MTSPAPTLYAASETYAGTTDTGPILQAFDVETGATRPQPSLGSATATAVATSDAGRFVYLGTANGIVVLDETTGHATSYDTASSIASVAETSSSGTVFFSDGRSAVFVFDGATGTPIRTLPVPNGGPISVAPDGSRLYVATPSGNAVSVVNPLTGRAFYTTSLPGIVTALAVDASTDELFAPALSDRKTYIVYLRTGKYAGYVLEPTTGSATQILVQPSSRVFYLGMPNAQAIVQYNVAANGTPHAAKTYHVSGVNGAYGNGLAIDRSGTYLFGIGVSSVYELSIATGRVVRTYPSPTNNGGFSTTYVGIALGQ